MKTLLIIGVFTYLFGGVEQTIQGVTVRTTIWQNQRVYFGFEDTLPSYELLHYRKHQADSIYNLIRNTYR
jgi:hypothetical protein